MKKWLTVIIASSLLAACGIHEPAPDSENVVFLNNDPLSNSCKMLGDITAEEYYADKQEVIMASIQNDIKNKALSLGGNAIVVTYKAVNGRVWTGNIYKCNNLPHFTPQY